MFRVQGSLYPGFFSTQGCGEKGCGISRPRPADGFADFWDVERMNKK